MRLNNEGEVKKWLRNLPLIKQELKLKIEFYKELQGDFKGIKNGRTAEEYEKIINRLKSRIDEIMRDTDRLFSILDESERLVMTAKYIKLIRWDFIEFHVFYSRRQAIRIHNEALKKLVGQEVSE